jgi:hypothetical protein
MYAPILKKLVEKTETYIERCLPIPGTVLVKEGDLVRPFDRLGECVYSQKQTLYQKNFKPLNFKNGKQFYYSGSDMGKIGKTTIAAPFNGNLFKKDDGTFVFNAAEDRYILLAGVWGTVHKIAENRAILIKTQSRDLLLVASTQVNVSGELVVFPNPVEILEKYYLESFSKNNEGKIVYVGHFADIEVVKRANEMGAAAVLAGSAHKETFNYAKSKGLGFGLISGFGKLETPEQIYQLLSSIAYRYVFLDGGKNTLRIPHSADDLMVKEEVKEVKVGETEKVKKTTKKAKVTKKEKVSSITSISDSFTTTSNSSIVREVKAGMDVLCLQSPNFGKIGVVDSLSESSIFVKFNTEKAAVEIKLPNFFIIE